MRNVNCQPNKKRSYIEMCSGNNHQVHFGSDICLFHFKASWCQVHFGKKGKVAMNHLHQMLNGVPSWQRAYCQRTYCSWTCTEWKWTWKIPNECTCEFAFKCVRLWKLKCHTLHSLFTSLVDREQSQASEHTNCSPYTSILGKNA